MPDGVTVKNANILNYGSKCHKHITEYVSYRPVALYYRLPKVI